MAKKSPVIHTVQVEFTQDQFDSYADSLVDYLEERLYDEVTHELGDDESVLALVGLTKEAVKADPRVLAAFVKRATDTVSDSDFVESGLFDYIYDDVEIFKKELGAVRKASEKRAKEAEKAAAAERARIEKEGVAITVNAQNADRARAVLQAAGLL